MTTIGKHWKWKPTAKPTKYWLGKKMSKEQKEKMSLSAKKVTNKGRFKKDHKPQNIWTKGLTKLTSEKLRISSEKGAKSRIGLTRNSETRRKQREARINFMATHIPNYFNTNIEAKVEKVLLEAKVNFKKQVPIKGIALVDFFLPDTNTIIECDGDYWHSKPEVQKRDNEKNNLFTFYGYNIKRLKGSLIERLSFQQLRETILC